MSFLLINRESFTFQTDFRTVLRFRFYLQFHFTVQRVDYFLASQYGRVKIYLHIYVQIVAQAFEHRVFGYNERNVQVPRRSSVDTFGSVAFQFNNLSVGYTGRDSDTYLFTIYSQYLLMRLSSITKGKMKFGIKVLSAESRRTLSSSSPMSEH